MTIDPRTPCLVGVAQRTVRAVPGPEPLLLWEEVARAAAEDAGAPGLLDRLDSVRVVHCESWPYDEPAARLCERLGAEPGQRSYSGVGGAVPGGLIADATAAIGRGELDTALVVGAEALATRRVLRRADQRPAWSHRAAQRSPHPMVETLHASELEHGVVLPAHTYPLLDVARRARRGERLAAERSARGAMMAPMTKVAAANPYAWFPVERSADELVTPAPDNRIVGWPYTKYTCAALEVDMAAAVLLASTETADALGVPADRRVYLHGYGYAEDEGHVAARRDLSGSPAMLEASRRALRGAGIGVDDVAYLDLYSCFASAVRFAADALSLDPLDPRGVTVTGGLPYAGGPASVYVLHSTAAMAVVLREDPGGYGLVSGVGMHMAAHGYSVWSSRPGAAAATRGGAGSGGRPSAPPRPIAGAYEGDACVAAYTVVHGRDGAAQYGLLVLDLARDGRTYARFDDPGLMADAESREMVRCSVRVRTDGRVNTATW